MKLSTSYVNFMIGHYIIEPIKYLDEFLVTNTNVVEFDDLTNWKVSSFNRSFNFFRYPMDKVIPLNEKYGNKKNNLFEWMSFNENKENYRILGNDGANVNWKNLSLNESKLARKLLNESKHIIDWHFLSLNESIWAKKLLKKISKTDWNLLNHNNSKWAKIMIKRNKYISVDDWYKDTLHTNISKIKNQKLMANSFMYYSKKTNTNNCYKFFDLLLYKNKI